MAAIKFPTVPFDELLDRLTAPDKTKTLLLSDISLTYVGGKVGFGTNDPKSNLHILTSGTSELGSVVLDRGIAITGIGGRSRMYFESTDSSSGVRVFVINNEGGKLSFGGLDDTATAFIHKDILVLDHNTGNVGIGGTIILENIPLSATGLPVGSIYASDGYVRIV